MSKYKDNVVKFINFLNAGNNDKAIKQLQYLSRQIESLSKYEVILTSVTNSGITKCSISRVVDFYSLTPEYKALLQEFGVIAVCRSSGNKCTVSIDNIEQGKDGYITYVKTTIFHALIIIPSYCELAIKMMDMYPNGKFNHLMLRIHQL